MMLSICNAITALRSLGAAVERIITAATPPVLGALTEAQTPADGLPASATDTANYASTAGNIVSAVASFTVNGQSAAGNADLEEGDVVIASILVTDDQGNTRTFGAGGVTVPYIAPTVTGSLDDVFFALNSGAQTVDASTVFNGTELVYTVSGAGATIDSATGIVSIATDVERLGVVVTITATNPANSVSAGFQVTVTDDVAANPDTITTPFETAVTISPLTNDTVAGQPVVGPELWVLSTDTSVTHLAQDATYVGDVATLDATGETFAFVIQDGGGIEAGKNYLYSYTVREVTDPGSIGFRIRIGNSGSTAYVTTAGTYTGTRVAVGTDRMHLDARANFVGIVEDVSIREIRATITAASVPAAQGTVIFTDAAIEFTPATGFTGAATITYTLDDGDGNTDTSTVTVTVGAAPAVSYYGAETRQGEGGIPVTGTSVSSVSSGNTSDWQIVGGFLSPSATGEDNLPTGAITITLDDATTVERTIVADAYSVVPAELEARQAAAPLSTRGFYIEGSGDYTSLGRLELVAKAYTAECIVQPATWTEDVDPRLSTRPILVEGIHTNQGIENLTIQGLRVTSDENAQGIMHADRPCVNVTFRQNEIFGGTTMAAAHAAGTMQDGSMARPYGVVAGGMYGGAAATAGSRYGRFRMVENWVHDVYRGFSGGRLENNGVEPSEISRNWFNDCYQQYTNLSNSEPATGSAADQVSVDIKDNYGFDVWSTANDSGGPHSSVGGAFNPTLEGVDFAGNKFHVGYARIGLEPGFVTGATGAKFNDPTASDSYRRCRVYGNLLVAHGQVIEISGGEDCAVYNNTVFRSAMSGGGASIYFQGMVDSFCYNNVSSVYDLGVLDGSGSGPEGAATLDTLEGYGNMTIAFNGDFSQEDMTVGTTQPATLQDLTIDDLDTAFEPVATSMALTSTQQKGAFTSGAFSAFDPPAAAAASAHTYGQVDFDGTPYLNYVGSSGDMFATRSRELVIAMTVERNSDSNQVLIASRFRRFYLQLTSGGLLEFSAKDNQDNFRFSATSSFRIQQADGLQNILIAAKDDHLIFVKNGVIDPLPSITWTTDGEFDFRTNIWRLFADNLTAASLRYDGKTHFFYMGNEFVDVETDAGMSAFFNANGSFKDLGTDGSGPTGTAPGIFLRGPAATFATNHGTGADFSVVGGTITDAGSTSSATLTLSSPADDATGVNVTVSPSLEYSENIQRGTGNITLNTTAPGGSSFTFDAATAAEITITNDTISINPASDMTTGATYTLTIPAGALEDTNGDPIAEVVIDFTTAGAPAGFTSLTSVGGDSNGGNDVTIPAGVQSGDLIVIAGFVSDASGTVLAPTGYTSAFSDTSGSTKRTIIYKVADGTEGGTTVDATTGSTTSEATSVWVLRPDVAFGTLSLHTSAFEFGLADHSDTVEIAAGSKTLMAIGIAQTVDNAGNTIAGNHSWGGQSGLDVELAQKSGSSAHGYASVYSGSDTLTDFTFEWTQDPPAAFNGLPWLVLEDS